MTSISYSTLTIFITSFLTSRFKSKSLGVQSDMFVYPIQGGLDKFNVCTIYNLQFFNGQMVSCLWFIKYYQAKKNWKKMQHSFIYLLLFDMVVVFLKNIYINYYAFIQNFKILNYSRFNWCVSISYTIKKIHPGIPSTTLALKYIFKISNFMIGIILSRICSICSNSSMFIGFFKIID